MVALYAGIIVGESVGYYSAGMLQVNSTERLAVEFRLRWQIEWLPHERERKCSAAEYAVNVGTREMLETLSDHNVAPSGCSLAMQPNHYRRRFPPQLELLRVCTPCPSTTLPINAFILTTYEPFGATTGQPFHLQLMTRRGPVTELSRVSSEQFHVTSVSM